MSSSDSRKAVESLVNAVKGVFKKHTPAARKAAWRALTSKKGKELVNRLARDPKSPVTGIARLISYREWSENSQYSESDQDQIE